MESYDLSIKYQIDEEWLNFMVLDYKSLIANILVII